MKAKEVQISDEVSENDDESMTSDPPSDQENEPRSDSGIVDDLSDFDE